MEPFSELIGRAGEVLPALTVWKGSNIYGPHKFHMKYKFEV